MQCQSWTLMTGNPTGACIYIALIFHCNAVAGLTNVIRAVNLALTTSLYGMVVGFNVPLDTL